MKDPRQAMENIRTVNHFIIYDDNKIILSSSLPMDFLNGVIKEAMVQKDTSKRYSGQVSNEKVFYVITKGQSLNQDVYLVSYMWIPIGKT